MFEKSCCFHRNSFLFLLGKRLFSKSVRWDQNNKRWYWEVKHVASGEHCPSMFVRRKLESSWNGSLYLSYVKLTEVKMNEERSILNETSIHVPCYIIPAILPEILQRNDSRVNLIYLSQIWPQSISFESPVRIYRLASTAICREFARVSKSKVL